MIWITAAGIDNWTSQEPRRAQELLPLLIGKLILASSNNIIDFHFPYGKSVQYGGYDGSLEISDTSPFYPKGKSVWEMGTNENIKDKFNKDYEKRTDNPDGVVLSETTFCFVTTRIWNHKQGIVEASEEKNQENKWKGVRIIDANNLERWLENCPSVQIWFSKVIGKTKDGLQDIISFWEDCVNSTKPNLNPEFFLYNRKHVVPELSDCFETGTNQLFLVADYWLEAVLCVASEVVSKDDLSIKAFGEKCLIVHSIDAFKEMDNNYENTIIIPCFNISDYSVTTYRNKLLVPVNRYDPLDRINKSGSRFEISPRTRHEFCSALEKIGLDSSSAYRLGDDLRCNFAALYRQICTNQLKKIPEWSKDDNVAQLIPALFVGAWEEKCSGDIRAICELSEMSYEDYVASVQEFTVGNKVTLSKIDRSYACVSIEEMWDVLWNKIQTRHFDLFKKLIIEVFSENDPTYELPEEKWHMSSLLGKESSYSNELKNGLIVSLIMLSIRGSSSRYNQFTANIDGECSKLVKTIFDSLDSLHRWQTICPYIPTFFEAAPDVVLRALEKEADLPDSAFWNLFKTSVDFLFGRSLYTHILWTLEKAVWDKRYAARAIRLLVAYAEKEYSYTLSNSPEETLYHIFCIWLPQGVLSFSDRKTLLTDIIKNHHIIAPVLFKKLLDSGSQTTTNIQKPKWLIIDSSQKDVTKGEFQEMSRYLFDLYLDNITPCYKDWHFVFTELKGFNQISEVIEKCLSQLNQMNDEDRLKLCKDLLDYISSGRKFQNDTSERIDAIEKLYFDLLPENPKYYAQYFSYNFDGLNPLPFESDNFSFEEERKQLFQFQKEKLNEMISSYGLDSVLEIISSVEDYFAYANAITEVILNCEPDWEYLFSVKTMNEYVAASIVTVLYRDHENDMLNKAEDTLGPERLGWVLSCLPISEKTTEIIDKNESDICRQVFWEKVNIRGIDTSNTLWVNSVIHSILQYHRPYSVIDNLAYSEWNEPKVIIEILQSALIQQPTPEPSGLKLEQVGSYDIERMFKKLYANPSGFEFEIAKLELAYLRVFDLDFEPKCLIKQILNVPDIYFELLSAAYRSDEGEKTGKESQQKNFSEMAYTALDRIHRIPGYLPESKSIDESRFTQWIEKTNELAIRNNYTIAHDLVLGQILSYSPDGADGIWPAECVRRIFEKPHSETLENNFVIGRKNQRGVYTLTAGKEEEKIAAHYKQLADKMQLSFPMTASILSKISDDYYYQAKAERAQELRGY